MAEPIIKITDQAIERVKFLLQKREKPAVGIRVGVKSGGCSGLTYTFEYADDLQKSDEIIEKEKIKLLVDPKAVMFLIGTTLDYVENITNSGFVFKNPNEKGRCGCGESFKI